MEQRFDEYSLREAMRLAASPAGQQLLALLRADGGEELRRAAEEAASGNYTGAKQALTASLEDPRVQALLSQLREKEHG